MSIKFIKIVEGAKIPSFATSNDVGMDLVAIRKIKEYDNGVILYGTGLKVRPPDNYYVEIVPRSSIIKTGWILANNVGVIDPDYTGELMIAMVKIDENAEELELPFCKMQLIVRKIHKFEIEETSDIIETERGSGGFGSTGDRNV